MKRVVAITLMGLLVLGGLAACGNEGESGQTASSQSLIRRGNVESPPTLDPWLAEDIHAFNILLDLYEGLVAENASGQVVPGVAKSWAVSEDGLEYRFELRRNAHWSDGTRVVAADFINGLRRMASPKNLSSYSFLLEPIESFNDVKHGRANVTALGVRSDGDSAVIIRLSRPSPHFLGVLAMPIAFPLQAHNDDRSRFHDPASFVGNGAYLLEHRDFGRRIRLRRNPDYWDAGSVTVEAIEYIPIANEIAELNMYRAGEIDITATIPPGHVKIVLEDLPNQVRIASSLALYYLAFDLTEPPLDNPHLRQALSMAIDRDRLVTLLGRGEQPAFGIVPPGVANYQGARYPWRTLEFENRSEAAQQAFKKANIGPADQLRLKYTYDAEGTHEKIALAVSAMWQEVLGIDVVLEKKEWKYFLDTRENRSEWQVMRFSWFGDFNDVSTFTDIFRADNAQNLARFASAEYDEALDQAASEVDAKKRAVMMQLAEEVLLNEYPIAPLYFYVSKHMVKPNIGGFEDNVLDRHPSKYLTIQPADAGQ